MLVVVVVLIGEGGSGTGVSKYGVGGAATGGMGAIGVRTGAGVETGVETVAGAIAIGWGAICGAIRMRFGPGGFVPLS